LYSLALRTESHSKINREAAREKRRGIPERRDRTLRMKENEMRKLLATFLFIMVISIAAPAFAQRQQTATKALSLTVVAQLVITTPSPLPAGAVGAAYNMQLASSGGTGAVTWAVPAGSTLPAGLTLSTAGVLAGTPTAAGTFTFNVTATDSGGQSSTITIQSK